MVRKSTISLLLAGWIVLGTYPSRAQSETEEPPAAAAIAQMAHASVVIVEQWKSEAKKERYALFSGFFVESPDARKPWVLGYLANYETSDSFQIALGRTMVEAKLIALDQKINLALFQLNAPAERPSLKIGKTSPSAVDSGNAIYVVGGGSSEGGPASQGRFACRESISPLTPSQLRLHLKIDLGSVGAPVFDEQKQLIGLLGLPVKHAKDCFHSIPAERLTKLLQDVRAHSKPVKALLGIVIQESSNAPLILGCRENSPASAAGLAANDVILSLGDTKITSLQELIDAIELLEADKEIEIKVLRGQQFKILKITPRLKPDVSI